MKVIVAVFLAIGSVSAIGSGPYLPSGWRPQGPAFFLPSEVQKPADNPIKDTILFETEASGSEGLREYGPPKVQESLNAVQALPDVVTDQTFYVVDNAVGEQLVAEVNVEQKTDVIQDATTESQVTEVVESRTQDFELETEVSTASYEAVTDKVEVEAEVVTDNAEIVKLESEVKEVEATVAATEEKLENVIVQEEKLENVIVQEAKLENVIVQEEKLENVIVQEEKLENIIVQEEKLESIVEEKLEKIVVQEEEIEKVAVETVEGVKNIAETLVNLENEIKTEQAQQSVQAVSELKITQEGSGSAQVPEGFLEYGPPGFREYGPPKGDEIQRVTLENNETRRRRFSPKFRSSKNKKQ